MKKETIIISGCDIGSLIKGRAAQVLVDGKWILTRPVEAYIVAGGNVIIETDKITYQTK